MLHNAKKNFRNISSTNKNFAVASSYLAISEDIKKELYFPNLLFSNIKYIEKQLNYGPRFQEYYWMNTLENIPYDFEYYETLKITSYCHFDYSTFPFDHHKCELNLGVTDRSINVLKLSKPILIFEGIRYNQLRTFLLNCLYFSHFSVDCGRGRALRKFSYIAIDIKS